MLSEKTFQLLYQRGTGGPSDCCVFCLLLVCVSSERHRGRVKTGSPFSSTRLRSSAVLYHISGHLHSRDKKSKIKINKVSMPGP